jgi:putative ABC transport system permease protein
MNDRAAVSSLLQDVRYAARVLRRQPRYALVAILTIALGIGATTTLFSVVNGVLVKPLPWAHADRLVILKETRGGRPPRFSSFSNAAYLAWRDRASTIDEIAAYATRTATLTGAGDPERIRITTTTASLFPALGVRPTIGTLFESQHEASGAAPVVVLAESLWRQRFGADPGVLGRLVRLDGEPYSVVGVLQDDVAYPDRATRAWIPFRVIPTTGNNLSMFTAVATLRAGSTAAQAAAEGTAMGRHAPDTGMTTMAIFGGSGPIEISATPLVDALTADVRRPLTILLVAVGLLLLTATTNVANVQLAYATTRHRELAIRTALGAAGSRVARQLLIESLVIGLAGGGIGLGLAVVLNRLTPTMLPADFPRLDNVGVDATVVGFAVLVSIVTSLVFGLLPALRARRLNLLESLAQDGTSSVGAGTRSNTGRARAAIMAAQIAIACVLLIGASLLGRSFAALLGADRGYDPSGILTARLSLPASMYTPERRHAIVTQVLERLSTTPGVASAAFTSEIPITAGGSTSAFTMPSRATEGGTISVQASPRLVSPHCFSALGMRIVAGRDFAETDVDGSQPVAIVNRAFARQYLGDNAIGAHIPMGVGYQTATVQAAIVGVVEDVRYPGSARVTQPEIYYSYLQFRGRVAVPVVTLLLRASGDTLSLAPAVRAVVRDADGALVPDAIATLEARLMTSLARPRLYAVLLGGFAVFALAIAGVGLFGVLAYGVAQRSRELAVRAALGAQRLDLVRLVLRQAIVVTAAGLAVGLLSSVVLARSTSALLYGITPYDPVTFVAVPVMLAVVALLACVSPALRAARLDPLKVLRS